MISKQPDEETARQPENTPFVNEAELRALDAQYRPFQPFADWGLVELDTTQLELNLRVVEDRRTALDPDTYLSALDVASRAAAMETGAIEGLYETDRGLTITVAIRGASWETALRATNEQLPDYFNAQLKAYDLASEVAGQREPVTAAWIRQLHEILTAPQATYRALTPKGWIDAPLPKGQFKELPNHVRLSDGKAHAYAPVIDTPAEIARLVDEISGSPFSSAHPVLQAAYAHHALVAVHPFADGNGRVARALASVYLRRSLLVPLLIWSDQRLAYFSSLEQADAEAFHPFSNFVLQRAQDALELVGNELGPSLQQFRQSLAALHTTAAGLTHEQLDSRAEELTSYVIRAIQEQVGTLDLPDAITCEVKHGGDNVPLPNPSYRYPVSANSIATVEFRSRPPAQAAIRLICQVLINTDSGAENLFRLETKNEAIISLHIRLAESTSPFAPSLDARIQTWAKRFIAYGIEHIVTRGKESLRNAGYA
jgi:Fic family protein